MTYQDVIRFLIEMDDCVDIGYALLQEEIGPVTPLVAC